MGQKSTKRNYFSILALFAVMFSFAQTSVWTGNQSTIWNESANWTGNAVPLLTTNVQIPVVASGNYPLIDGLNGTANCNNISIENGVAINVAGYGSLRIAGILSGNGKINAVDGGNVTYIGTAPQVLNGSMFTNNTVSSLTIYNTISVTLAGTLNLTDILSVQTGVFETAGGLTLKSNAAGTARVAESAGVIAGNVTVERYIPARRAFRLISSPTTGGTINSNWQEGSPLTDPMGYGTDITGVGGATNGFDVSGTNNPSLFTHNNATATWQPVTTTTGVLNAGDAYRLLVRGDRTVNQSSSAAPATNTTLRSTGVLTVGNVFVTNLNPAAGGFSFVGNPYQSAVDMEAVLNDSGTSNLNPNFYYVWDPTVGTRGAYVTVDIDNNSNTNPSSVANNYLQPNQAFFVQTQALGGALLTFRESHKHTGSSNANPALYKTTTTNTEGAKIALSLYTDASLAEQGTAADGFVVRFNSNYSNELDALDAVKPVNQDENIGVVNTGTTLSLESRALPQAGETIALATTGYRANSYTYKVSVSNIEGVTAYLQDAFLGTLTPLQNNAETLYSFTVVADDAASIAADRFEIVFQTETLGTGTVVNPSAVLYPNPSNGGAFSVQVPQFGNVAVNIYNQLGQKVSSTTTAENGTIAVQPLTQLATGIYLVEVNNGQNVYTQKLIVKN